MRIAIVKYNAGNIRSVSFALQRLGIEAEITDDPAKLRSADKVIFPGVGEASTTMQHLRKQGLDELLKSLTQPVLGVCLGLQLMCSHSEEGDTPCIGIFEQKVKKFVNTADSSTNYKIPHMGWNSLHDMKAPLFNGFEENPFVYFVHSYYAEMGLHTAATCHYTQPFSAALHKDNFYATQFHPEKSGDVGHRILQNFLDI